ncbi:Os06g0477400 [Oryza sativa Japonica Group]|uniref:Os06g0477400 protein n=1 Tax=Oryza sativa subsp. japonica TaxID=39947 RepID=A0A0P0WWU6_ORYSJ|nr:hypothetical protein EE612_034158 [Oryza sativa]BAS97787.1 Os06g0477400 [Oryza sativa Japonica Group]
MNSASLKAGAPARSSRPRSPRGSRRSIHLCHGSKPPSTIADMCFVCSLLLVCIAIKFLDSEMFVLPVVMN